MPETPTPAITHRYNTFTVLSPRDALACAALHFVDDGRKVGDARPCTSQLGKSGYKIKISRGIATDTDTSPHELEIRAFGLEGRHEEGELATSVEIELNVDSSHSNHTHALAADQIVRDLDALLIAFDDQKESAESGGPQLFEVEF